MYARPCDFLPLLALSLLVGTGIPAHADTHSDAVAKGRRPTAAQASDSADDESLAKPLAPFLQRVIELTNIQRLKAGLPALKRQKNLLESADWLARDMAEHHYFDHNDSGGRAMPSRLTAFKYSDFSALGENIAMGQRTPEEVVEGWMNSPGHRANILSHSYSEIGVGYVRAAERGTAGYWVQDFGSRFDRCPVVINNDSVKATSSQVKLSIHGEDWVEEMRLSNDGTHWTAWEEFRRVREWNLEAGSGKRTVFIEVRQHSKVAHAEAAVLLDCGPVRRL